MPRHSENVTVTRTQAADVAFEVCLAGKTTFTVFGDGSIAGDATGNITTTNSVNANGDLTARAATTPVKIGSHAAGYGVAVGTVTWTTGTGSPESAVTAPVGSLYTRTNGGAGTTLYVKESGAGNTGWIAK